MLGHSGAMNNLALCYEIGKGVESNLPKVIELFSNAVKIGDSDEMFNLALCYKKGLGVRENLQNAFDLFC